MAVVLHTEKLGIGYPGNPVGRNLDITIEQGKVTMLLGPNGCGKTTLFRTLLGLLAIQGGRVMLGGHDLMALTRNDIARRIAYVPQVTQGYFPFRVLDVVLMGRAPYIGMFESPALSDVKIAKAALAEVGLSDFADRPLTAISGGQRQLALIARALAQAAPVLIMDEPTANLDYANQHRVMVRARALAADGRSVVISSHNPDHALRFADHAVLMQAGTVIASGTNETVLNADNLSEVYGIPIRIVEIPRENGGFQRVSMPDS